MMMSMKFFVVALTWSWVVDGFVLPSYRDNKILCPHPFPVRKSSLTATSMSNGNDSGKDPSPKLPPGRRTPPYFSFLFDDTVRLLNPKSMASYQTKRAKEYDSDIFKTSIFGTPTVFVTSEEGLILLGKEEARTRSRAGTEACFPPHHQRLFGPKAVLVQSGDVHNRLRRLIQPSLSSTIMETVYQPIVDQGLDDFLSGLKGVQTNEDGYLNLVPELRKFFISIALEILLGRASAVPEGLSQDLTVWSRGLLSAPLTFIPWSTAAKAIRARKRIIDAMQPLLNQERNAEPHSDSLLGRLVSTVDEETGEKLSDDDILDNVLTIIFAGSDTTASAAASMCMVLSLYPELEAHLRQNPNDIDRFVGSILQQYPPAPFGMRLVKEALSVKGYDIPKNWMVVYGFAGAQAAKTEGLEQEQVWKSFVKQSEEMGPVSSSVSFGAGPRMCPGRYLASLELKTLCQKLVGDSGGVPWTLQEGQNFQQTYNPGFFPKDGLKIKLKRLVS
ncbi:cytochrome P450 [Nitzschia inconspicua]|uniref:Cytochrome P450 n=1 Tax=Nitzschia inconspicua TaxID=303405 RepID=A0A9K3KG31_9STRA|nr:cytochrome P450 [Nitzschia inconspicua]